MNYEPDMNDGKHVFVFGSNLAGRHGAGAAWVAKRHWGAVTGIGDGRSGYSYAIPTKDQRLNVLPLARIGNFVGQFLGYAARHPELKFLVTALGTGLAGYEHKDIAPMFANAPANCVLPEEWVISMTAKGQAGGKPSS